MQVQLVVWVLILLSRDLEWQEGKDIRHKLKKIEQGKLYPLEEACSLVADTSSAKFDETVEISIRLGVDPKKADQNVRGTVALPHGLGKEIRVAVFAKGEKSSGGKGCWC